MLSNTQVKIVKQASDPYTLFRTEEYEKFMKTVWTSGRFLVGHNRKATRGEISSKNAHPFAEKNIVLVHNGTIMNQDSLSTETVEVDSHAICHSMVTQGWKKTLEEIHGAFALVWFNTEDQTLYLARNDERPLGFITTESRVIFASELSMVDCVVKHNNMSLHQTQTRGELKPGVVVKLKWTNGSLNWDTDSFTPYVPKVTRVYGGYNCAYDSWEDYGECSPPVVEKKQLPVPKASNHPEDLFKDVLYVSGDQVVFVPVNKTHKVATVPRVLLEGRAYRPNVAPVAARVWLPSTLTSQEVLEYCNADKIMATVDGFWKSGDDVGIYLKECYLPKVNIAILNGVQIPLDEYDMIMDTLECEECDCKLDSSKMDAVKVEGLDDIPHQYIALCKSCFDKLEEECCDASCDPALQASLH
jgi:hypothetical protein